MAICKKCSAKFIPPSAITYEVDVEEGGAKYSIDNRHKSYHVCMNCLEYDVNQMRSLLTCDCTRGHFG